MPLTMVRRVRRHRIVAEKCRRVVAVDNGPAREPDAVCRHRDAVGVHFVHRHRIGEQQHRRAGLAHEERPPRLRAHREPDPRHAGHRHRRREGHAHLDPLARPGISSSAARGNDVSATAVTVGAARTVTVTVSAAL